MNYKHILNLLGLLFFSIGLSTNAYGQVSDPKLLALIKNELGVEQGATIPEDKFDSLIYLDAGSLSIPDLTGLDNFHNLAVIDFSNNEITDLSVLANLPNLRFVNLANNKISDVSGLSNAVSEHTRIIVRGNCISDFTPVDENLLNPIEFIGTDQQKADCSAIEDINILYAFQIRGNESAFEFVYRGYSSNATEATISFGDGEIENAIMDGLTHAVTHVYSGGQTDYEAVLTLGDQQLAIDLSFALESIILIGPANELEIEFDPLETIIDFSWSAQSNTGFNEINLYENDELVFNDISTTHSYALPPILDVGKSYSWRVRNWSGDNSGLWSELFVFSTVVPNQPPSDITLDNFSFTENNEKGISIGNLQADDPNVGDTHAFTLIAGEGSDDNSVFGINGNQLIFNGIADHEVKSTYYIRIKVDDGRSGIFEKIFVIDVLDLNEAPSVVDATFSIDENSAVSTLVRTITASDPDGDDLTFSIVSGNDLGAFQIDQDSGELTVADSDPLDFETNPIFNLAVEVSDSELTDAGIITINLNDVEEEVLGTFDERGNNVRLYPNPTQNFMNIEWDNFERAAISGLSGKELFKSDSRTLDLQTLRTGVYLITLIGTNNERITFRIIKE